MNNVDFYIKDKKYLDKLNELLSKSNEKTIEQIVYMYDILNSYKLDQDSFIATALFVLIKKDETNYEDIKQQYNDEVAHILSNLNTVEGQHSATNNDELENIRNMLIVMSKDIRVLIILLTYNLYRIEHLQYLSAEEQRLFVKSVKEIYAPLSARLSLNEIKNRMEDACFKFLDPQMYEQLSLDERLNKQERQKQVDLIIKKIDSFLKEMGINGKVYGREKHLASVYNKLQSKQLTLGQIYDLMAVRVVVYSVEECYTVLGKINSIFTILPSRFKDYIATPKPNGYQSIHTCILAENNRPVEVQIRTQAMHEYNEYGVAAHWIYKDKGHKASSFDKSINWFKQVIDNTKDLSNKEFTESVKMDMFNSEIYAQTPNGKITKFPVGANCIDFAYAVHTSIGNRCVGAKINGKFVPLTTELKNGDVCEILLGGEKKGPSRDWLKIVKTSSARSKINSYFKKQFVEDNIRNGKSMLEASAKSNQVSVSTLLANKELNAILTKYSLSNIDEMYAMIGGGTLSAEGLVKKLMPKTERKEKATFSTKTTSTSGNILVDNSKGMMTRFAKCCLPIPGDDIVGFVSLGKGVTVHRADCINIKTLDRNRFIPVSWDAKTNSTFHAKICLVGQDVSISNVTNLIDKLNAKIVAFEINPLDSKEYIITISLKSNDELNKIVNKLLALDRVESVKRI